MNILKLLLTYSFKFNSIYLRLSANSFILFVRIFGFAFLLTSTSDHNLNNFYWTVLQSNFPLDKLVGQSGPSVNAFYYIFFYINSQFQ